MESGEWGWLGGRVPRTLYRDKRRGWGTYMASCGTGWAQGSACIMTEMGNTMMHTWKAKRQMNSDVTTPVCPGWEKQT